MDSIGTYAIVLLMVIASVSFVWIQNYLGSVKPILGSTKLVVTAHPDDESMFFGPFIAWETSRGFTVHLLCLSDGDFDGQGLLRSEELKDACDELGVPQEFLNRVGFPEFRDDPGSLWSQTEILRIIEKYCEVHDIEAVVSFDSYGVSGHLNHISIYRALKSLANKRAFKPRIYVLESVSILRKYFLWFDVLCMVLWEPDHFYALSSELIERPQRAMLRHRSQLVWFRHLYMRFSKYMVINTFRELFRENCLG